VNVKHNDIEEGRSGPLDIHAVLRSRQKAWKVKELTDLLSLGRRTIYDAVDNGQLCAMKLGTAVRISPSDAVAWVEARTTGVLRQAA
jgi:excisionase family DNA binding protein